MGIRIPHRSLRLTEFLVGEVQAAFPVDDRNVLLSLADVEVSAIAMQSLADRSWRRHHLSRSAPAELDLPRRHCQIVFFKHDLTCSVAL